MFVLFLTKSLVKLFNKDKISIKYSFVSVNSSKFFEFFVERINSLYFEYIFNNF